MMDKKELNVTQLDTVAGGNWLNEIGDFLKMLRMKLVTFLKMLRMK